MVDHLCSLGHRRIGILAATPQDESIGRLRLEGYRGALMDHGIQYDPAWCFYSPEHVNWYTMANGYSLMKKLMASGQNLTAVFAISDSIAIGACKAVFDAGKSCRRITPLPDLTGWIWPTITIRRLLPFISL